jgi:hypothetical protein
LNQAIQCKQRLIQYIVSVFEDTMRVAQHTHRETIFVPPIRRIVRITLLLPSQPRDMVLVLRVRSDSSWMHAKPTCPDFVLDSILLNADLYL